MCAIGTCVIGTCAIGTCAIGTCAIGMCAIGLYGQFTVCYRDVCYRTVRYRIPLDQYSTMGALQNTVAVMWKISMYVFYVNKQEPNTILYIVFLILKPSYLSTNCAMCPFPTISQITWCLSYARSTRYTFRSLTRCNSCS